MQFRIADTFIDSLARLTNEEQKAVKTTAFDLQMNPACPGLKFHKLNKARDPNFWSVRVGGDIRLIVHKTRSSLLLCYVDHHDPAYNWAERRKLETHPKTGAAQMIEVRETVEEIPAPRYMTSEESRPPLFIGVSESALLDYGVPEAWLDDVIKATEDTLLDLADHLPREAAEALLDLATGVQPHLARPAAGADPFEHPDAQRRFRVMHNIEELERALEYPWEKWVVFLHPAQRELVEREFNGPARVSGSAGTGKTIVALHRAVHLARANPEARVLLTTFSESLANALRVKLRRLASNEPRIVERLEIHSLNAIGRRLYELNMQGGGIPPPTNMGLSSLHVEDSPQLAAGSFNFQIPRIASRDEVRDLLQKFAAEAGETGFSLHFLMTEWEQVVDEWQVETWADYRDVRRLGRKTRLPEKRRAALWSVFEKVRAGLKADGLLTDPEMFGRLAFRLAEARHPPFDFVVVDEAQDVSVARLRFLAALAADRPNGLFLAGDLGQRIFQTPFSWKALGVDIRGRSSTLRINYRTSHQIRMQADRLLPAELADVDGNKEERRGSISVFNGPEPSVRVCDSVEEELAEVGIWLDGLAAEGLKPHEIGVFVRSPAQLDRARGAVEKAGLPFKILDETVETISGHVSICTMHLAKGLEFRAVAVMACDDEIVPLQERIERVADETDLEEVYNTERHLLYVACTRARDFLLITSVDPASEFLDDLKIRG
ncbi:MAG: UvrD-helicase domain-containing protein [Proteobacteria bacterium]|nr:UvrD-helicase domain-containing protein [Pseudomonadota bacterium]